MKKNLIICMVVLLGLCWYVTAETYLGSSGKYKEAMAQAKALEEKKIYIRAIDSYKEALSYKSSDFHAMYGIAQDYKNLKDEEAYENQMHSILINLGPNETALKELYQYYMDTNCKNDAAELVYDLKKKYPEDSLVDSLYEERKGDYEELFIGYEYISSYNEQYAIYKSGRLKGLLDQEGDIVVEAEYDEIAYPAGDRKDIAVVSENSAYYINEKGYKVDEPDEKYTYLSGIGSNSILAQKNGKYGYLDSSYREKTKFEWEDATKIYDKLGAVKKDGKWALINEKFELQTGYIYDDVLYDEWRRCSVNQVVWVNKGGKYQLVDKTGALLTENIYEDVKMFAGKQPCAVKKDGKWGFVDLTGKEVIKPAYEGADSFNKDFAPVMDSHSMWGMIDLNNKVALDYTFDELKPLNSAGIAPFQRDGIWSLLRLKIYE